MTTLLGGKPTAKALPFAPILADLDAADRAFANTLAQYRTPFASLIEHLKHYRGKRLRPALMLLTAKAVGKITPQHHTLAAAVEMIHTATLVHDDVLDEAEIRRHVRTVNAEWGNKISILLGDMLFTHAFHLTSQVDRRACELIGDATNRVCAGELRQVSERGNLNLSEADYFAIIDGKTAALTEVCCRLGAIHAGATEFVADKLANFGRCLGIAFQIADDLLDLTGDEGKTGKTLGTDIEQQKLTLPLIHCLSQLPEADAEDLRTAIRSGDRPATAALLAKTDSLEYAKRTADDYASRARQELECLPPSECRAILQKLTEWATRREK
ncbi:polyprenyl synthetase family protein [Limnoglobus roseus]|uniref:Polyprenyl synthetase family protein n=1 Tax=Limnoglobus roseus TaxID=2598579 RepID=A0A5C1ABV1_9BACT|nr:polyprenyl synthetase family protein [Limnoglobus roseus]QEL15653.1 polyprenyl synthetase family protein [Limnoglobus roseus]